MREFPNDSIILKTKCSTPVHLIPLKINLVKEKVDFIPSLQIALAKRKLTLNNGDIISIASKLISVSEGRLKRIDEVIPSNSAKKKAKQYKMDPKFVQIVINESDNILGGLPGLLLTIKKGIITVNAGVDASNVPKGYVSLWPLYPQKSADTIRKKISCSIKISVLIVDSQIVPLRLGTIGLALAISGFPSTIDLRDRKDLYGNSLIYTWHSIADDLAAAAHLLMGEADEKTPIVLIRGFNIDNHFNNVSSKISPNKCLYMNNLLNSKKFSNME